MADKYYGRYSDPANTEEPTQKEQGFYQTPAWRKLREQILRRDHYMCQLKLSEKCERTANTVHHIKDLEDFPELALVPSNLTSCCWACHELTKARSAEQKAVLRARSSGVRVIKIGGEGDVTL